MLRYKIVLCTILIVFIAGVAILKARYDYRFPYGKRGCCLPCMMVLLRQYALDHTNRYPDSGQAPLDALRDLHPRYTVSDATILAGISGDISATVDCVEKGQKLTENESSWVYFPGFELYDDKVAIIWERQGGVTINGERLDGHAVGFSSGNYDQIPSAKWESFVADQKELRTRILAKRKR